jgi:hypothetical protein
VYDFINDENIRNSILPMVKDISVKNFWTYEFSHWDKDYHDSAVRPLVNQLQQLLNQSTIRNILGQGVDEFDIKNHLQSKNILIANISKNEIGEGAKL